MGLDEKAVENIYQAGILHDIGKIGTTDHVLGRLGKLSRKEMKQIREHPALGADILSPLTFFCDIEPLVRHHHERYDGGGYPDGKKGDQIPLGARILAVCDAFETMITGRPNIPKKEPAQAADDLKQGVGTRFDPDVVQAFFRVLQENPDITETGVSFDSSLDLFKQNMAEFAEQKLLEKKFTNPFPSGF